MTKTILQDKVERACRRLLPAVVATCEEYGISPDEILEKQHPVIVVARRVCAFIGREVLFLGMTEIGLGLNCGRWAVYHAVKVVSGDPSLLRQALRTSERLRDVDRLEARARYERRLEVK